MNKFFEVIKKNWAFLILIAIAVKYFFGGILTYRTSFSNLSETSAPSIGMVTKDSFLPANQYAPVDTQNRIVLKDTNLSLQVENVSKVIIEVEETASKLGGFMVDSSLSTPEGASSGSITVRVPSNRRLEALKSFRKMAVKVVSENITGQDVTDEYVDLDARLAVLNTTKVKFETILSSAVRIEDMLNVQRELINLQSQIDQLVGQQKYLQQSAKLSRITVSLSTDELALPYAPDNAWRPGVVFKTAVRTLIGSLRDIISAVIWVVVYSPFWLPLLLGLWYLKRHRLFIFSSPPKN